MAKGMKWKNFLNLTLFKMLQYMSRRFKRLFSVFSAERIPEWQQELCRSTTTATTRKMLKPKVDFYIGILLSGIMNTEREQ